MDGEKDVSRETLRPKFYKVTRRSNPMSPGVITPFRIARLTIDTVDMHEVDSYAVDNYTP